MSRHKKNGVRALKKNCKECGDISTALLGGEYYCEDHYYGLKSKINRRLILNF